MTLDGKPAVHPTVMLTAVPDPYGMGGDAVTDETRHFRMHLSGINDAEGLEQENFHVTFSKPAMPNGSPVPAGKDAADVEAIESLSPHLATPDPSHSRYSLKVENAVSDVQFDVKSKP